MIALGVRERGDRRAEIAGACRRLPAETPPLAVPSLVPSRHDEPAVRDAHRTIQAPSRSESLELEVRALRNAERALRDGNPGLALAFLQELDRQVPNGQLAEERDAAGTLARCARGDQPFGVNLAAEFTERHPGSVYRARVEQACTETDSPGARRLTPEEVKTMKNVRTRALLALLCGAGFSLACSGGGAVNIGNTNVVGSQLSDYAATWDGYAEAYNFMPDGSDRVRLTIAANGQGTLEVGNAALLATADRSERRISAGRRRRRPGPLSPAHWRAHRGIPLSDLRARRCRRIGFSWGQPRDLYAAWCALQTRPFRPTKPRSPTAMPGYTSTVHRYRRRGCRQLYYTCLPKGSMFSPTGRARRCIAPDGGVDAGRLRQAVALQLNMACQCTATGCASIRSPPGTPVAN